MILRRMFTGLLALLVGFAAVVPVQAAKQGDPGPQLIRDAEIEGLLRLYTRPIFKAASSGLPTTIFKKRCISRRCDRSPTSIPYDRIWSR